MFYHCTQLNEGAEILMLEPQLDSPRKDSPLHTTVAYGLDVPRARHPLFVAVPIVTWALGNKMAHGLVLLAFDLQNNS